MAKDDLATKSGKVEISTRWFGSRWPSKLDTQPRSYNKMAKAIKAFEAAKKSASKTKLLLALKEVETLASDLSSETAKVAKDHKKFVAEFRKDMDTISELAVKQSTLIAKTGNKSTVIWHKNLADSVEDNLEDRVKKISGFKLGKREATVSIPEIVLVELEERNADTQMYRELDKVHVAFGKKCAAEINTMLKDKAFISGKRVGKMDDCVDKWAVHFEKAVREIPDQIIGKIAIHESIAKVYKRERTIGLVKAGTGVAVSTAAVFAPGTQALAIAGAIRSGIALSKEIASYAANIEMKMKSLQGYINALEVAYSNGASKVASELTLSLLNGALGIDVLPTLKKAQDDLDDVMKNTSLSYTKLQKKQAEIMKMMKKLEEMNKALNVQTFDNKVLKQSSGGKKIIKLEKNFDKLLENCYKSAKRLSKAEVDLPKLKKQLDALDKNPTALKVGAGLMRTAGSLAWSIGGTVDASFVKTAAEQSAALFMNSMMILQDVEDAVIDHA